MDEMYKFLTSVFKVVLTPASRHLRRGNPRALDLPWVADLPNAV
jgi:hypothetical protein